MSMIPVPVVTAAILAGGRGTRLGGADKGLLEWRGRSLAARALDVLKPQTAAQLIVANRNLDTYAGLDVPVLADAWPGQPGPLAGIYTALRHAGQGDVLLVPADAPLPPPDLLVRLTAARREAGAVAACVHDGTQLQPLFCLLPAALADSARAALEAGEYSVQRWLRRQSLAVADYSTWPRWAWSVNTPEEWEAVRVRSVAPLHDRHGRSKRKLRVSLTDRCNFRCPYCMPETPDWLPKSQLFTRPELRRVLTLMVRDLGITHLRLTGGEPLLRKDIVDIVQECQELRAHGLQRVSMTSNGILLAAHAPALKAAGLDDVNVSLDALDEASFRRLSGNRASAREVQDGILAARAAGLPVKINTVAMRGYNEGELLPLVRWAATERIPLRLIEFMPLDGKGQWSQERVVPEAEMLDTLRSEFQITPLAETDDPARYYLLNGSYPLGVISTISRPFCKRCDRLRLTASGELFTCLFSPSGHDLRLPIRQGATDTELLAAIRAAVWNKSAGYAQEGARPGYVERPITMHTLGG